MKITLLVVGKTTNEHLIALIDEYQQRLKHYISFSLQVIPELKNAKSLTETQQKSLEAEMILRSIAPNTDLILLDEHGEMYRSVEWATFIEKKMATGHDVCFVIGGPYGFADAVYQRANGKVSLSKMTFSHQMVRLFFVEQIYRAMTILRGEPYHHE